MQEVLYNGRKTEICKKHHTTDHTTASFNKSLQTACNEDIKYNDEICYVMCVNVYISVDVIQNSIGTVDDGRCYILGCVYRHYNGQAYIGLQ